MSQLKITTKHESVRINSKTSQCIGKLYKIMDKIIWLDGHVTTISSEEANRRMREVYSDNGSEWVMLYADSEFVWKGGCWMQR